MKLTENTALLCIDFINEMLHPDGKIAQHGNAAFAQNTDLVSHAKRLLQHARNHAWHVIHIRVGFDSTYSECPANSPIFSPAKKAGILQNNTWSTNFIAGLVPQNNELVINKPRVSAFYETSLEIILRHHNINKIVIAGCATDLAVQSTARDAHDRDFEVIIIEDCCAAKDQNTHNNTIALLKRVASITTVDALV